MGLCSVEEAEVQRKFLDQNGGLFASIITVTAASQLTRYFLIQRGYKINSLYFVVRDKESYFHAENKLAERYMIALTLVDPKWQGEYGQKLRFYLRNHRKPN